jgi:hypothetical protein
MLVCLFWNIIDTVVEEEIPLPNLKYATLTKVMEYCTLHRNDTPPEIEKPLRSNNLYPLSF